MARQLRINELKQQDKRSHHQTGDVLLERTHNEQRRDDAASLGATSTMLSLTAAAELRRVTGLLFFLTGPARY